MVRLVRKFNEQLAGADNNWQRMIDALTRGAVIYRIKIKLSTTAMLDYQKEFIAYSLECNVLKFGNFTLKSGRVSPYFFNTGLFNTGEKLRKLGGYYAQALMHSGIEPDILYGPAYKGIPLVTATAIAYAELTKSDLPFAFNRKETKDHGEGGDIVGSPLQGDVLIVDDVITAGTSVKESVDIIVRAGAKPAGVLIALDRQEIVSSNAGREKSVSAIQEVKDYFKIPVISIITLENIIDFIKQHETRAFESVQEYRRLYGVKC